MSSFLKHWTIAVLSIWLSCHYSVGTRIVSYFSGVTTIAPQQVPSETLEATFKIECGLKLINVSIDSESMIASLLLSPMSAGEKPETIYVLINNGRYPKKRFTIIECKD